MAIKLKSFITKKPVLIAAGVIAVVALGGAAVYVVGVTVDEDWSVYESIVDFAKGVKNEPKGCCPPHDGLLTKTECDQSGGFNWQEGECPGFAVKLTADSTSELSGGGTGYTKYVFDMYTCSDSVYSDWKGHWDFYWTWYPEEGAEVNESFTNREFSVTISPSGIGTVQLPPAEGGRTATFKTDVSSMSVDVSQQNLEPATGSQSIIKGAGRCLFEFEE